MFPRVYYTLPTQIMVGLLAVSVHSAWIDRPGTQLPAYLMGNSHWSEFLPHVPFSDPYDPVVGDVDMTPPTDWPSDPPLTSEQVRSMEETYLDLDLDLDLDLEPSTPTTSDPNSAPVLTDEEAYMAWKLLFESTFENFTQDSALDTPKLRVLCEDLSHMAFHVYPGAAQLILGDPFHGLDSARGFGTTNPSYTSSFYLTTPATEQPKWMNHFNRQLNKYHLRVMAKGLTGTPSVQQRLKEALRENFMTLARPALIYMLKWNPRKRHIEIEWLTDFRGHQCDILDDANNTSYPNQPAREVHISAVPLEKVSLSVMSQILRAQVNQFNEYLDTKYAPY
ncbi:hypothetical protein H4R33_000347 [Dimargaris cristalligena]|nr:hypothetical protein H4R33_000347 [Dimargaris cristalligena]